MGFLYTIFELMAKLTPACVRIGKVSFQLDSGMTKRFSIQLAAILSMMFIACLGCDFGTYQQRASEPVPADVEKVGDSSATPVNR